MNTAFCLPPARDIDLVFEVAHFLVDGFKRLKRLRYLALDRAAKENREACHKKISGTGAITSKLKHAAEWWSHVLALFPEAHQSARESDQSPNKILAAKCGRPVPVACRMRSSLPVEFEVIGPVLETVPETWRGNVRFRIGPASEDRCQGEVESWE